MSRFRLALCIALGTAGLLAPTMEEASPHEAPTKRHLGAMTNWASDAVGAEVSAHGREPVEASRVTLAVRGGAVVVQWSLSYQASVTVRGRPGNPYPKAWIQAMAALERDGVEIAGWSLGEDQAQGGEDALAQARVTGTVSGLFVDQAPGAGRKTYVLKVWNARAPRDGVVTVSSRTMICEER